MPASDARSGGRISGQAPSTIDVVRDTAALGVGFAVALGVLRVWPDRPNAAQYSVVSWGLVISLATTLLFSWATRHRLSGMLSFRGRPFRYSWPNAIGLFAAISWASLVRDNGPDWGIGALAVLPVIGVGSALSDLLWARAASPA